MVFLELMAAQQWINDHPRVIRNIRKEVREETLEEAAQMLDEWLLHQEAAAIRDLKKGPEFSSMEKADKYACIYHGEKRDDHEWYYGQAGFPDDVAVCRYCGITALGD